MAIGKVRTSDIAKIERFQLRQEMLHALECIRSRKDFSLFVDLLTESEQLMVARRIHIAKRLLAGQSTRDIREECKAGQDTIFAVNHWLRLRCEEYATIFPAIYEDMHARWKNDQQKQPIVPYTFRWVRKKYPLHFLLFNMLLNDIDWGQTIDHHPAWPYRPSAAKKHKMRK